MGDLELVGGEAGYGCEFNQFMVLIVWAVRRSDLFELWKTLG